MAGELLHAAPNLELRWERVVFLSDIHVPFHDKVLWANVVEFLKWYKPHTVFWNGDIADCYAVSSFVKDADRVHSFQSEMDQTVELLEEGRLACPKNSQHYYVPGNHEHRIERFLNSRAPELASLRALKLSELLQLKRLKIRLAPRQGVLLRNNFLVHHGTVVRGETGASAQAELKKSGMSGLSGHVHRLGSYRLTDRTGVRVWFEQGCLCETDPEYILGAPNWSQGFVAGEFDVLTEERSIDCIPAVGGRFAFRGKLFG